MSGPVTQFDADECQALLDLIDKMAGVDVGQLIRIRSAGATDEEQRAYEKLRTAGKFYIIEVS